MIGNFFNSARLVFEIALVIGAIVLVYWWNPLNIFGGEATLQPTANIVSEIREMGELITAEYYGEVIASINEARLEIVDSSEIQDQSNRVYQQIIAEINNLKNFQNLPLDQKLQLADPEKQLKRRERKIMIHDAVSNQNILDKLIFLGEWEVSQGMEYHEEVLAFLYLKMKNSREILLEKPSQNQINDLLFYLYTHPNQEFWEINDFIDDLNQSRLANLSRKEAKKKLALIGRGTVKAGFDFGEINENTYHINEEVGELHFFGLTPKILNADINPWFIPEKGIPGFDILIANKRVNFKDSKKVKEYAVRKLTSNALKADIINQAERYGGETLMRLFSLLSGNEIKKVIFHHDKIISLTQHIAGDRFINYEEAKLFEMEVQREKYVIDSLKMAVDNRYNNQQLAQKKWETLGQMIQDLQQFEFEASERPYNYFSSFFYEMSMDSLIESKEFDDLVNFRAQLDQIGFMEDSLVGLWVKKDTLLLQSQFSANLSEIIQKELPAGRFVSKEITLQDWKNRVIENDIIKNMMIEDQIVKLQVFEDGPEIKEGMEDLLYPYQYSAHSWESWTSNAETISYREKTDSLILEEDSLKRFWVYDPDSSLFYQINLHLDAVMNKILIREKSLSGPFSFSGSNIVLLINPEKFNVNWESPLEVDWMTSSQAQEWTQFIRKLLYVRQRTHQKGPITKANEWFANKWENKSTLRDKFNW
ncbi:MAG: DUF4230 domain-containing protein [Cyclobacteriaceae bacterium]